MSKHGSVSPLSDDSTQNSPQSQPQPQLYQQDPSGPPQAYSQQGPGPQVVYAQPQTTVVTQTINPKKMAQNRRDWNAGLCGCLGDIGTCLFAYFCCPCFNCAVATQLGENACGPLCCCCLFEVAMRTKVRTMYGISGSICCDALTLGCCPFCAMVQMKREMDLTANENEQTQVTTMQMQ